MTFQKRFSIKILIRALSLMLGLSAANLITWKTAYAASSETKQQLTITMESLRAAGSASASGNALLARQNYDKAKANWNAAEPSISKKEAQEMRELFSTLDGQLSKNTAADDVKSTISDMIDELREDMK